MPTTYHETLEYVDGSGTVQEIALNTDGSLALRLLMQLVSHAPCTFEIQWATPPESALDIPFASRCKIRACRASADGGVTFSGGTIIFQGRRTDNHGSVDGGNVFNAIVLSDAWWDLQLITYQVQWKYISGGTIGSPTYSYQYFPDLVLFQAAPWDTYAPAPVNGTISTWQQISAIVNFSAAYASGDDAVQIALGDDGSGGAEITPCYVPWYPYRCGRCADALQISLRPHPGTFTEIDYSLTTPAIHFRDRAHMTAVTLPYKSTDANGVIHVASNIQPLPKLQPDNVRIYYRINGTVSGAPVVTYDEDYYPSNTSKLRSLDFPVDITGASIQRTTANFSSATFDPTALDFWRKRIPSLQQIVNGGQVPNDGDTGALGFVDSADYNSITHPKGIAVIGDDGTDYSGSYATLLPYITEDDIYTWMAPAGGSLNVVRATVKAFFTYDKKSTFGSNTITDSLQEHEHSVRVILTNLPSGTYVYDQLLSGAEDIPSGLAQALYTELSTLQWKLSHTIFQVAADATSVPTIIKPGKHKINLSGGLTAWETMNAVPESVAVELFRTGNGLLAAKSVINCGPVNHLEPGYLVQLHNLFVNRDRSSINPTQRVSGLSNSSVDLSANGSTENSVPAHPVPTTTNLFGLDAADSGRNIIIKPDATTGQITVQQNNVADGTELTQSLVMAELTGNGAPGPSTLA